MTEDGERPRPLLSVLHLPLIGVDLVEVVPSRSAAAIMAIAMRSFTLPPGFSISGFTYTADLIPRAILVSLTSGVPPTA
jgi:hypothetical protein